MLSFDVKIKDTASPRTKAMGDAYAQNRHLKIMAASGAKVVKSHFIKLDQQRHRGSTPFHFYARAAQATSHEVRGRHSLVRIDHEGIARRRFGGPAYKPRVAKYFTIPVDPIAHGRRVREFGDAVTWIINRRSGKGVVTLGGRVIFALTQEIKRAAPDPTVLPTDGEIATQVTDDLRVWTKLQEDRSNG